MDEQVWLLRDFCSRLVSPATLLTLSSVCEHSVPAYGSIDDTGSLAGDDDPHARWPSLTLPGILQLELMTLHELLLGQSHSPSMLGEFDGVLVFLVPDAFIEALARLTDDDVQTFANRWHETAEHLSDWSTGEVAASLLEMRRFSERARRSSTSVLDLAAL
jgi:hypothetical protein